MNRRSSPSWPPRSSTGWTAVSRASSWTASSSLASSTRPTACSSPRHWVLPIFVLSVAAFGLLVSFPFEMLALGTILFLLTIPIGVMRYRRLDRAHVQQPAEDRPPAAAEPPLDA